MAFFFRSTVSKFIQSWRRTEPIFRSVTIVVWTDAPLPHLVTTGSQVFSKGLDGTGFVVLYQLSQACIRLVVSCNDKLSILVLGNDKMATPVVTPWEEKHSISKGQSDSESQQRKSNKSPAMGRLDHASLVGQDKSNGFVTEADEETAQVFISQQIFCVPGGQRQTQAIKRKCLIFFWVSFFQFAVVEDQIKNAPTNPQAIKSSREIDLIIIDSISDSSLQIKMCQFALLPKAQDICIYKE